MEGEGDSLERRNYRRLKLTDQILKIAERITEKLIRQEVNVEEFLMSLEQYLAKKKKNFYFVFANLEKVFDRVPRDDAW